MILGSLGAQLGTVDAQLGAVLFGPIVIGPDPDVILITVEAYDRSIVVAAQDRTIAIDAYDRVVLVPDVRDVL